MSDAESRDRVFIEHAVRLGIIGAAVIAVVMILLWLLKGALTVLAMAWVIAYLFDPLIDRIQERGVGRRVAILLLLAIVGGSLLGVAFFLIPAIQRDVAAWSVNLPRYVEHGLSGLGPRVQELFGITLPGSIQDAIERVRAGELQIPLEAARGLFERVLRGVTGTAGALVSLLIIPVLAYYLLVEFDRIRLGALDLVPRAYQNTVATQSARVDTLISGFIRGQLTVCVMLGVLYAVGFAAIGIDLAVVIGVVSGLLAIVPYVGGAFAFVSASSMAVLQFGFDIHLALVVGWYLAVQGLEGFVLTPLIVGGSLGMHPVTVIVALLIGGDLLGFLGLLIAVPLAAVVQVFLQDLVAMYRQSPLYERPADGVSAARPAEKRGLR